jgi:hypothetical protein
MEETDKPKQEEPMPVARAWTWAGNEARAGASTSTRVRTSTSTSFSTRITTWSSAKATEVRRGTSADAPCKAKLIRTVADTGTRKCTSAAATATVGSALPLSTSIGTLGQGQGQEFS